MKVLDGSYKSKLDQIAEAIQNSDELTQFLDTEEEDDYKALIGSYEGELEALYTEVATDAPLQILELELAMLDEKLEGLFLPRLLGYAILRGSINENFLYKRPQEHVGVILDTICTSMNFDQVKTRIGEAVQVYFAISSDIWVSSFIENYSSKTLVQFLRSKRLSKFRHPKERKMAYQSFRRQFIATNFYTASFPESRSELFAEYDKIVDFLQFRIQHDLGHSSYEDDMTKLLSNTDWGRYQEYQYILVLALSFIEFNAKNSKQIGKVLDVLSKEQEEFNTLYFEALEKGLENKDLYFNFQTDKRVLSYLGKSINEDILRYYKTTAEVATKGFVHEDTIELVRTNYNLHEGLSRFNECLRYSILGHFLNVLKHLTPSEYADYFELNKTLSLYINIFDNQQFNQGVKDGIVKFVRKCLKVFTDKRGRDYQDIKKFVTSSFLDLGFMNEKELKEFFKTKKKRKVPTSA